MEQASPSLSDHDRLAALGTFREQYPALEIWCGELPQGGWVWFARGVEGNPWLIMSADLRRFESWLAAEARV